MTGSEFYQLLRQTYSSDGHLLYRHFTFKDWLFKRVSNTYSFRFNVPGQIPKSIPQNILIMAWDADTLIDDKWLMENFKLIFHTDCRLNMLNFLLDQYSSLR